jgi:hypothetical protein
MHENAHALVARPGEPHPGGLASDGSVHLGDWNGSPRLSLDLVEQPPRDPRCEGEHAATIAPPASRKSNAYAPEVHEKTK